MEPKRLELAPVSRMAAPAREAGRKHDRRARERCGECAGRKSRRKRKRPRLHRLGDEPGDEEAGNHEEDVDADEAAVRRPGKRVIGDDAGDRDPAQSVDVGAVFAGGERTILGLPSRSDLQVDRQAYPARRMGGATKSRRGRSQACPTLGGRGGDRRPSRRRLERTTFAPARRQPPFGSCDPVRLRPNDGGSGPPARNACRSSRPCRLCRATRATA